MDDVSAPISQDFIPEEQFKAAPMPTPSNIGNQPSDFIPEEEFKPAPEPSFLDSDAVKTVSAAARGISVGLLGPVEPWIAKRLGETPQQVKALEEQHSIATGLGNAAGLIGGLMTGAGVGGLASAAGEAIPAAAEGAGYLTRVGNSALKQAAEMAVIGSSDEAAKMISDPTRSAETALSGVGLSAALGAGTGAVVTGAISPLWKATVGDKLTNVLKSVALDSAAKMEASGAPINMRPIIKKALSIFGGVSEEDIDAYLQHHEAIANLPEFEEVYSHALDHIGNISDALEENKMSVAEAKLAYKDLEQQLQDTFKQAGADAKTAAREAARALKEGQAKLSSDLLTQAVGAGDKASAAANLLRDNIVAASDASYRLLDDANVSLKTEPLLNKAESIAKELESEGTTEARAQAEAVRQYGAGIKEQFGESVSGPQAKKLIQGLDKVSKYDYNASAFDKNLSSAMKELRYEWDSALKDAVPEYRKAMEPLSKDAQLLSKLKRYGTPESASVRVKALKNVDAYKNEMPLLRQLEERSGIKFTHEIEPYANPELKEKLLRSMPEHEEARKTAEALEELKSPKTKRALEESLQQSEEYNKLLEAQQKLQEAKAAKEGLGVTPQTLQSKLRSVAKPGKSIANEAILSKIPAFEGKSLPEIMNLLRIQDAFTKNATRGSKHVNLYGAMIGALGGAAGHAMPGIGIGSAAGAYIDNNGPTLVKKLLDKYISSYGDVAGLAGQNPGVVKTMLGKILGHSEDASGEGFKTGADYLMAVKKGDVALTRAAKNVFLPNVDVVPKMQMPNATDRLKLDKLVAQNQANPNEKAQQIVNGKLNVYLPDHHGALAAATGTQLKYIEANKPADRTIGILNKPMPPSQAEQQRYNRLLDIATDPKIVLQHVKDGTWQPTDFVDLKNMYPTVYNSMVSKITGEIANAQNKGIEIPYKTRLGISVLIGQPLDASLQPSSIQAAQPQPQTPPGQPTGPQGKAGKGSPKALQKAASMYQTPGQNAEKDRSSR